MRKHNDDSFTITSAHIPLPTTHSHGPQMDWWPPSHFLAQSFNLVIRYPFYYLSSTFHTLTYSLMWQAKTLSCLWPHLNFRISEWCVILRISSRFCSSKIRKLKTKLNVASTQTWCATANQRHDGRTSTTGKNTPASWNFYAQQSTFQEQCEIRPFKAKYVKLMEK